MSKAADLYALQETDLLMQAREATVADADARLGESDDLQAAREAAQEARDRLHDLQRRQHEAEFEVDEVRRKMEPFEKKLYSGTVVNPKELMGLEQDVSSLKSRQKALEDDVLEAMAAVEDGERALASAEAARRDVEAAWSAEQERLRQARSKAGEELATLRQRRSTQTAPFDAATLRLYEGLRSAHGGRAVAKVERGTCQGCRITLPMNVLQKARAGNELVHCSSCERILYLT